MGVTATVGGPVRLTGAANEGNLHAVPDDAATAAERVVVPAGPSLHDAARWVGQACWAELRWHEVLSAWMADPDGDTTSSTAGEAVHLWSLRADAGERAAMWHHRLPELSELPRHGFLCASGPDVSAGFDELAGVPPDSGGSGRLAITGAVLGAFLAGYTAHQSVAVGPADGPVARSLTDAIIGIERARAALPDDGSSRWSVSILP